MIHTILEVTPSGFLAGLPLDLNVVETNGRRVARRPSSYGQHIAGDGSEVDSLVQPLVSAVEEFECLCVNIIHISSTRRYVKVIV